MNIVKGRPFVRRYRRVPKTPIKQAIRLCEEQVHVAYHPVGLPATEPDLAAITRGIIEVEATAKEPVGSQHVRVVEAVMVSTDVEERTEAVPPMRRMERDVEPLGTAQAQDSRDKALTIRSPQPYASESGVTARGASGDAGFPRFRRHRPGARMMASGKRRAHWQGGRGYIPSGSHSPSKAKGAGVPD